MQNTRGFTGSPRRPASHRDLMKSGWGGGVPLNLAGRKLMKGEKKKNTFLSQESPDIHEPITVWSVSHFTFCAFGKSLTGNGG